MRESAHLVGEARSFLEMRLSNAERDCRQAEEAAATATIAAAESARVAMECANNLTRVTRRADANMEVLRKALSEADSHAEEWHNNLGAAQEDAAQAALTESAAKRERKQAQMQFKQTAPAPRYQAPPPRARLSFPTRPSTRPHLHPSSPRVQRRRRCLPLIPPAGTLKNYAVQLRQTRSTAAQLHPCNSSARSSCRRNLLQR